MTPKQEQFARLYIETGNATEAYRRAYSTENMKPETITNEAYKLLQSPDISAMINGLKAEHRARHCEWKHEFSEFSESLKKGKMLTDVNIADRLYQRAMGYEAALFEMTAPIRQCFQTALNTGGTV